MAIAKHPGRYATLALLASILNNWFLQIPSCLGGVHFSPFHTDSSINIAMYLNVAHGYTLEKNGHVYIHKVLKIHYQEYCRFSNS